MEPTRHLTGAGVLGAALLLAGCTSGGGQGAPPSPGQLRLGAVTYAVVEGAGVVHLVVVRAGGTGGVVTARLASADGSAVAPADYAALATTVVFADGDAADKVIDVAIVSDAAVEPAETFTVTLSAATGGAAIGTPSGAVVTILDDDAPVLGAGRLNDTGATACAGAAGNGLACGSASAGTDLFPRQDAEGGRDLTARDDRDGRAGFSFTKLDAAGAALPDQSVTYAAVPWACVLDRVTGLTWEVRPSDGGLRDRRWTYSWYRSDGLEDGGSPGVANRGACVDQSHCDTEKYRDAVNALGLCGRTDWRLPERSELLGLVDHGATVAPLVDAGYFPDALPLATWTASPDQAARSWTVDFSNGHAYAARRDQPRSLRLTSGGMQR